MCIRDRRRFVLHCWPACSKDSLSTVSPPVASVGFLWRRTHSMVQASDLFSQSFVLSAFAHNNSRWSCNKAVEKQDHALGFYLEACSLKLSSCLPPRLFFFFLFFFFFCRSCFLCCTCAQSSCTFANWIKPLEKKKQHGSVAGRASQLTRAALVQRMWPERDVK